MSTGFYTTVQDLGRFGFQEFGVPYSGVMDERAARLANALLGNDPQDAVLEQTMTGSTLRFDVDTYIAITGANMQPKLDERPVELNRIVKVSQGSVLSFSASKRGFRSYLGVSGGFGSPNILESRSMYSPVTRENVIKKGDGLIISKVERSITLSHSHLKVDTAYLDSNIIDVHEGPEYEYLDSEQKKKLLDMSFLISKNNSRMAYQLDETFSNNLEPILTSGVFPGTVQLTPSGKLIVLMKDCQTTGGYPRVMQLTKEAISVLAQKYQGQKIKFNLLKY
ncbi:biotin-dependent carboxyltransferase family protein [Gaetbulibacter aestuarii]|uniref:5-oxoprolinase subunit C family protein n=1 Tax=Gaetbulibacter aestuarii TaxID=1502358 RepID=UPI0031E0F913